MSNDAALHPEFLSSIPPETLLKSAGGVQWYFTPAVPSQETWQTVLPESARPFKLDACINLDLLCPTPQPSGTLGVVYGKLTLDRPRFALFGFDCTAHFKLYVNGKLEEDTFKTNDVSSLVMATNHRVAFPLQKGDNLLAILVERGSKEWNFCCLGIPVEIPVEPALACTPWLSWLNSDRAAICFSTTSPLGCGVQYKEPSEEQWHIAWHKANGQILRRTYHNITLPHLKPGSTIQYQVIAIHPSQFIPVPISELATFQIPGTTDAPLSLFFTADLQFSLDEQAQILQKMCQASHVETCNMVILCGDVNSRFLPSEIIQGPISQFNKQGSLTRNSLYYIRGNHELRGPDGDRFLEYFANTEGKTYGIIRWGETAFLVLDSWEDKPSSTPGHAYCKWNLDEEFLQEEEEWLHTAMKDPQWTTARRHIVLCHGSAYSHHDSCHTIPYRLQKWTDPYFAGPHPQFKIDLWLTGHVHHYMRSIPFTNEIAAASMPMPPFLDGSQCPYPVLTVAGPNSRSPIIASCFRLDFSSDKITMNSWDQNGNLLETIIFHDDGTIEEQKGCPHFTEYLNLKP